MRIRSLPHPRRPVVRALLLAFGVIAPGLHAQVDDLQLKMALQLDLPLRWDNVAARRPYWMDGERPVSEARSGLAAVTLQPGRSVTVRLPPGTSLRLRAVDPDRHLAQGTAAAMAAQRLMVEFSNGSGAYVAQRPVTAPDGRDLVFPSRRNLTRLARVSLAHDQPGAVTVALFVSRQATAPELAPYRALVELPGQPVRLQRDSEAGSQPYWPLAANRAAEVELAGPLRLALRMRVRYVAHEASGVQDWRIAAILDDTPFAQLAFKSGFEGAYAVRIDGREALLTREAEGHLEIPSGRHRLRLTSSAPLYMQLLALDEPDYLLPGLNAPRPGAAEVRAALAARGRDDGPSPGEKAAAALQVARDNHHRQGGAVAAAALRQLADERRDVPDLTRAANDLQLATFLREVPPRDKPAAGRPRPAWFLVPRLLGVGEVARGPVVAGGLLDEMAGTLQSALFMALKGTEPLVYDLPARFAPADLQLAIHAGPAAADGLYVQFDDAAPVTVRLAPVPERPAREYAPSAGEALLRLLAARYRAEPGDDVPAQIAPPPWRGDGDGTLSGAFGQRFPNAPLVAARVVDLPLPTAVQRVRVWRAGAGDGPVWLALSYRAGAPFRLSEQAYLDAEAEFSRACDGRLARFLTAAATPAGQEESARELASHGQPLLRTLQAQARRFAAWVATPQAEDLLATDAPSTPSAATAAAQAEAYAARGQWLPALESWSGAAAAAPSETAREQALYGRVAALNQLGETFLAEQLLRQEVLHGKSVPARRRARLQLLDSYRAARDSDAVQALLAAALLREAPSDAGEILPELAEALLENGEPDLALEAGLLLPEPQQPLETLLRAAFAARWWSSFERLRTALPDPERRAFWQGQRDLLDGSLAAARDNFLRGGPEGAAYAAHSDSGRALQTKWAEGRRDADERLADWGAWLAAHPGPRRWQPALHLADDYAGAQMLYARDRDMYFTALRAETGRPVRLGIAGPVRLRVEGRPLHDVAADATDASHPTSATQARLDGWMSVRGDRQLWVTPISDNAANPDLSLVGRPGQRSGRAVTHDIELGPGWHELEIGAGELPLLVRAWQWLPELPLPLLPQLNRDTLAAAPNAPQPSAVPALLPCTECAVLLDVRPDEAPRRVRLDRLPAEAELTRLDRLSDDPPRRAPDGAARDDASLRAARDWPALLAWPAETTREALLERVTSLAWLAETEPGRAQAALSLAEAIRLAHPGMRELATAIGRLARDSAWVRIESVAASAGLRGIEIAGWDPDGPAQRVRRALLPSAGAEERYLSGSNRLVFSLAGEKPTRIQLRLAMADVGALPAQALVALLKRDGAPAERIVLEPAQHERTLAIDLPAGDHVLRLWIENPVADQFLRVGLHETGALHPIETVERFYHVATPGQPVRLTVEGPAWLRIDEWVAGRTESRHLRVGDGWQQIDLPVAPERKESLYRIWVRNPVPGRPRTVAREIVPPSRPVADPPWAVADVVPAPRLRLDDRLPLGGQEDGTWTLGLARRERLYGYEDSLVTARLAQPRQPRERFTEFVATHRYFAEDWNTHYRADLLARQRERGGPTFGVRGYANLQPAWSTWSMEVAGSAYAQNPGDDGGTAASWALRASIDRRQDLSPTFTVRPHAVAFLRGLSGHGRDYYRSGEVDQDVYSPYLDQHRRGLMLGAGADWRPWLDTQLYGRIDAVSNRSLNPIGDMDHLATSLGWRQLAGPLWLDARWDGRRYRRDADRAAAATTRAITVELGGEHWLPRQERLEVGLTLHRDITRGENLVGLQLLWHFGNGRAYRDFRDVEVVFRPLREPRAPADDNNRMREEP